MMTSAEKFRRMVAVVLCVLALLTLSACDGGIFGTGDGSDISDLDTDAGAPATDISNEQPGNGNMDPAPDSDDNSISFENLLVGSQTEDPLLSLINLSGRTLSVNTGDSERSLISELNNGKISTVVSVPLNTEIISVFEGADTDRRVVISPLNLAAYSVTTLIARQQISTQTASNTAQQDTDSAEWEIIALPTISVSNDASIANVRIVQAIALDELDTAATLTLHPQGVQAGSTEVDFTDISASAALSSDYKTVGAGDYELRDSLDRFPAVAVQLQAGHVYTLIIRSTLDPVLLIQQDSLIRPSAPASGSEFESN